MSRQPSVVALTPAPRAGRTKTRLQPLLGTPGCARLQRALIIHIAAVVAAAAPQSLYVAVHPPDARQALGGWVSVAAARTAGLRTGFLPPLRDLDAPEDAHALSMDDTVPLAIRSILSRPVARAHPRPDLRPPQPEGPA